MRIQASLYVNNLTYLHEISILPYTLSLLCICFFRTQYSASGNQANQYNTAAQQPQYGVSANPGPPHAGGGYPTAQDQTYAIGGYTRPLGQTGNPQGQQQYTMSYGQNSSQQGYQVTQKSTPGPIGSRAAAPNSTVYPSYSANTAGAPASSYAGFTQPASAGNKSKMHFAFIFERIVIFSNLLLTVIFIRRI